MSLAAVSDAIRTEVARCAERRLAVGVPFFVAEAGRLASLCHLMAERFARGGRLVALGATPAARSDARHVAVEFVHPVIVGKRALPALALTGEGGSLGGQVSLLVRGEDIAVAFGIDRDGGEAAAAVRAARDRGALTIAFGAGGAEWEFSPPGGDDDIRQEVVETLYHLLWELVHVFFEHRGLLRGRNERRRHDAGASSFLYPFLDEDEDDLDAVLADVAGSVRLKAQEISALRTETLNENAATLAAAAAQLAASLRAGGQLLALGNGGSATDAMDVVADFRAGRGSGGGWPAVDLTEDAGILTAIANDIGPEAIFSRQVIAYGQPGDVLLALSTSGNSANVIAALGQARERGLGSVALVGYDGGQVAGNRLADHVIITRSEHIPRIQEAQASAYHVLRELVG